MLNQVHLDITALYHYGIILIYGVVIILYRIILSFLPPSWVDKVLFLLVFSDASVLSLLFIGGFILLEREEQVWLSLFTSPLQPYEYILSKSLAFSLITSLSVLLLGIGHIPITALVWGIVLIVPGNWLFTQWGLVLGFQSRSLNGYLLSAVISLTLFLIPLLWLVIDLPQWILLIHPSGAFFWILKSWFAGGRVQPLFFFSMVIWLFFLFHITLRVVNRFLFVRGEKYGPTVD